MATRFPNDDGSSLSSPSPVEQRTVFVSHSHADRALASQLQKLVETVFSGVVKVFASSDRGPAGGIMPGGDEWYSQIEANLRGAEAVWVLATPGSITRPWIYWEAGTGRAICPRGLVVLRVGLTGNQVPSPLNNFQSYDGLALESVVELLGKVAHQIGMTLAPVLVDTPVKVWVEAAGKHQPEQGDEPGVPNLTPERLDRIEAAIARLEAMTMPSARPIETDRLLSELVARDRPWKDEKQRPHSRETYVSSLKTLASIIDGLPADSEFAGMSQTPDLARMTFLFPTGGGRVLIVPASELLGEPAGVKMSARGAQVLSQILTVAEEQRRMGAINDRNDPRGALEL